MQCPAWALVVGGVICGVVFAGGLLLGAWLYERALSSW